MKNLEVKVEYRDNCPALVYYLNGVKQYEISKEGYKSYEKA